MDGLIVIRKEKQMTSHDVVAKVKKIVKIKKVGHTGTLDPNATGVLPLLLGQATKLSKYLIEHDKTYEVTLKLGIKTTTADEEGEILQKEDIDPNLWSQDNLEEVFHSFAGKQKQMPPMYSAIKVKGKKLYEYARQGVQVEVEPREIQIYEIVLDKIEKEDQIIQFRVSCSKGTYMRSLCEDIAKALGTIGYMKDLNRVRVGRFSIEQAITIAELEENQLDPQYMQDKILSFEQLVSEKESIQLDKKQEELFLNGVKLSFASSNGIYRIYNEDNVFIGTGIMAEEKLKRDVIK